MINQFKNFNLMKNKEHDWNFLFNNFKIQKLNFYLI